MVAAFERIAVKPEQLSSGLERRVGGRPDPSPPIA
jgi:hypothetical protein